MSNKKTPSSKDQDGLDLQDVKHMTIEEAVRKDSELKVGISETDSVLDRYIKQHRDEVKSQKFQTTLSDFDDLDTETLDNFIKQQRKELTDSGIVDKVISKENQSKKDLENSNATKEDIAIDRVDVTDGKDDLVTPDIEETPHTRKRKWWVAGGLVVLIIVIGVVYNLNHSKKPATTTSSLSTSKVSTDSSQSKTATLEKDKQSFDNVYGQFFVDSNKTKLKNSEFAQLSKLEEKLNALKKTTYYEKAKEKYDGLTKQMTAIQSINAMFESDVIVNGEKLSATVKSDANFDKLSADLLNTGNANLDTLLQSAITEGKEQLGRLQAKQNTNSNVASQTESQTSPSSETSDSNEKKTPSNNTSTLQRNLSRVPYNDVAIADSTNAAWNFSDGVLDRIIATSHSRGYFSGNDYILEKVNIINGNGYYNMFKTDGTYLFSINCKTGYFVGNASGHSDALDY